MLIYVNTIKCCACETLNLVQCSITMNVKLLKIRVVIIIAYMAIKKIMVAWP